MSIDFETSSFDKDHIERIQFSVEDMINLVSSMSEQIKEKEVIENKSTIPKTVEVLSWKNLSMNPNNPAIMIKQVDSGRTHFDGLANMWMFPSVKKMEERLFEEMKKLEEQYPEYDDFIYEEQSSFNANGDIVQSLWLVGFKKPLSYKEGYVGKGGSTCINFQELSKKQKEEMLQFFQNSGDEERFKYFLKYL